MPRDERPWSGTVGARSISLESDVAGTHNGLRSHGRIRCLVINLSPNPLVRLPADTYRRMAFDVGAGALGNRAVKLPDSKNGEWENQERTFAKTKSEPPRLHRNPGRRASKRRIEKDVASGVSRRRQGRNDKTPWGSTHRVLC